MPLWNRSPCRRTSARRAAPARVRHRGWFINDETLLSHWKVERRDDLPFIMAFEALLRCGGNMVIPGTGENARRYRRAAADMGLILTHHHAEPLGAEMFASVYPELEARTASIPTGSGRCGSRASTHKRGCGWSGTSAFAARETGPFWEDDPRYDTPAKRGALISSLIRQQYNLVKQSDPDAVCCTNLYGEVMDLYRQGCLDLPADVIKIWADNGYGRMVSRRQGNDNPRVPALPPEGDGGAHGVYYHASFYDLQAASHITMLPNSAGLVCDELKQALARGAGDYWLVNCSNIKPHLPLLDLIARLWQTGEAEPVGHSVAYAQSYYGTRRRVGGGQMFAPLRRRGPGLRPPTRTTTPGTSSTTMCPGCSSLSSSPDGTGRPKACAGCAACPLSAPRPTGARTGTPRPAPATTATCGSARPPPAILTGPARILFQDSLLLQARLYAFWSEGALAVCQALQAGFVGDWARCFYLAGRAKRAYTAARRRHAGQGTREWIDFYANECQTDVKQTAQLCGYLMSFARTLGEGPHFTSGCGHSGTARPSAGSC